MDLPLSNLGLFLVAALALNLAPGPDMLYVMANGLRGGPRCGVVAALGIGGGALIHGAAAALGVSALIATSPLAFDLLRYAGAAYLAWLGIKAIREPGATLEAAWPGSSRLWPIFFQGVVTNVLNPKVALFFLAFLPQFAEPSRGSVGVQVLFLGLLFNTSGTIVNIAVGLGASGIGRRLATAPLFARVQRWVCGVVFIGLACRLLAGERAAR